MRQPWFMESIIKVSGTTRSPGAISLVKARTLSITTRLIFNGSGTVDATINLYYSPDGSNYDTEAFATWDLTVDVGATVQRTVVLDVPEHGFIYASIVNGDSSYTLTSTKMWYTIQSWEKGISENIGDIRRDTGED